MRILLTGLMTVHYGRIENGNIGNYYITEATVRELHRVFPGAEIATTLQMTDEFCARERVHRLSMELFYGWNEADLTTCFQELGIAEVYHRTGYLTGSTLYIDEVMKSDLVLDFSGEMWGDHAEPVGKDRFLTVLLKDRVAQLLKKPVVLLAGSQGPFHDTARLKGFVSVVLENFAAVLNREPASVEVLAENGWDVSNVKSFTDVAFLFEPCPASDIQDLIVRDAVVAKNKPTVGCIVCGFNMVRGPYDAEPRSDDEFAPFADAVEFIVGELGARVFLMSHQNGFTRTPEITLINGRDYPYAQQLFKVIHERNRVDVGAVVLAKGPYTPRQTKAIIGQFDMFVSGRIHAFVAAVSQRIPTVIINRGHGGHSHRNVGFARSVGMEDYIADPSSAEDMKEKIHACWENRERLRAVLRERMPKVEDTARSLFDALLPAMAAFRRQA